jgi:LacI family transcriptional regulator
MTTIKDIAKLAKVSSSTVSRILNNDNTLSVSDDTRQRIFSVAKELNYKKSVKQKQKSDNALLTDIKIGVVIWFSEHLEYDDPFYISIRKGVEKECIRYGATIDKTFRWMDGRDSNINLADLDGVIVIGRLHTELLNNITYQTANIVFIDYLPEDTCDAVLIDFEKATCKALEHLFQLGHSKIGYIGGKGYIMQVTGKQHYEDVRMQVFEKWMKEKGYFNKNDIFLGEWSTTEGYNLMKKAIKQGDMPTAFFIGSDPMAIGALRALDEAGIKVPQDVAIVSFDDIEMAEFVNPPLSTIKVYSEEMGTTAFNLLIDRLKGREASLHVYIPTQLMIRKSCGADATMN